MASAPVTIRFRTTEGDAATLTVPLTTSTQELKELLYQNWPADGPIMKSSILAPTSPNDFRLIIGGRNLEPGDQLSNPSFSQLVGDIKADSPVTIHVIVRPYAQPQRPGKIVTDDSHGGGCGCCIM